MEVIWLLLLAVVVRVEDISADNVYTVYQETKTWEEANTFCRDNGGVLPSILSKEENDLVRAQLSSGHSRWIGLNDKGSEGKWKWINGDELRYRNFYSGERNTGIVDCAFIYSDGDWGMFPCFKAIRFLCQTVPDPCSPNNGGCGNNASCENDNGNAKCTCNGGFQNKGTGNKTDCQVPDPCSPNNGGCGNNASCENDNGNAKCTCNGGFQNKGTGNKTDCQDSAVTLQCDGSTMIATIAKNILWPKKQTIILEGCDQAADTYVADNVVTMNFTTCNKNITKEDDKVIQANKLIITYASTADTAVITRGIKHVYSLQCSFNRRLKVVSSSVVEVDVDVKEFKENSTTKIEGVLNIHDSQLFSKPVEETLEIGIAEPIYLEVKQKTDNENFKLVVDQCFATSNGKEDDTDKPSRVQTETIV